MRKKQITSLFDPMTYREKIVKVLEETGDWVPAHKLRGVDTPWGWIGDSGKRRCRELYEEGKIERRLNGRIVEYRKDKKEQRVEYNPDGSVSIKHEV